MGYRGTGASFWSQVDKTETCWIWTGAKNAAGYGMAYRAEMQTVEGAHRFAYRTTVGEIPDGAHLDHLCGNRACVRPGHLEPVTARENLLRSPVTQAAINAAKTHCDHGHQFTPENTYTPPKRPDRRDCRACRSERSRSLYRKQVA